MFLPPRPGDDTLVLVDRRSSRADEAEAAAALTGLRLDVIFPVLHGPYGEDGTIQGLLELANVAYVGLRRARLGGRHGQGRDEGALPGARPAGVATGWSSGAGNGARRPGRSAPPSNRPCRIRSSSSPPISAPASGISKVHEPAELGAALDQAFEFDRKVVVEAAVRRRARDRVRGARQRRRPRRRCPGEIVPSREFYDYEAKYIDGHSRLEIPAALDESQAREVQQLGARRLRRDRRRRTRARRLPAQPRDRRALLNEINTLPGFTTISMYSKLWAASGVAYATLVDRLIALATRASHREARAQDDRLLSRTYIDRGRRRRDRTRCR